MSTQKARKPIKITKHAPRKAASAKSESAPVRRYRTVLFQVLLLLVAGSFAALTYLVKTVPSFAIDLQIAQAVGLPKSAAVTSLMNSVSWPGFMPQSAIIVLVCVVMIYALGLHWEAVAALSAALLSPAINYLVKALVHRIRPTGSMVNVIDSPNSYSFPSGHVMFYISFFGFIAFLAFSLMKPSIWRTLLLNFLGSLVVLIGPARVYLGQHWASDVLGAYLMGTLLLVSIIQFYRWGKKRFFVHQPTAAHAPGTSGS